MHENFADWYRPCTTGTEAGLTEDQLQKRWIGVEKLAAKSAEQSLHLVRIILQKQSVSQESLGKFRMGFKDSDATFQMSGNDLELSVLAGAVACQVMTEESDEADAVALGLICASIVNPEQYPWANPFIAFADSYLDERLQNVRSVESARRPKFPANTLKTEIETFVARIAENNGAPTSEAAKELMNSLVQALGSTHSMTLSAIAEMERQSSLRKEETDILWWMTSGVSRDLGVTFKHLKTLAASLVAGKELASLVSPPGVLPARTLLQRMIPTATGKSAGKPIGLIAAVKATDRGWRESVASEFDSNLDILPTLAAIKQSLSTDGDEWIPAYKKSFCLKSDILLPPADLSLQMHRECLLANLGLN